MSKLINLTPKYTKASELTVITVYYNPCSYKNRYKAYQIFINTLYNSGINVITVECAFNSDPFTLKRSKSIFQFRSKSLLWQKERLINLAVKRLPASCKYVAWIDCDVIFDNVNWAIDTCNLLSQGNRIVQLWDECKLLDSQNQLSNKINITTSFASCFTKTPFLFNINDFQEHGHSGYGWAMHREIFETIGLYEYAIAGSADHYMVHALVNDFGTCISRNMLNDRNQILHIQSWGEKFYKEINEKIGVVPGCIYHIWHGNQEARKYDERLVRITEKGYNPYVDIVSKEGFPLEWADHVVTNKPEIMRYISEYFFSRKEDTDE